MKNHFFVFVFFVISLGSGYGQDSTRTIHLGFSGGLDLISLAKLNPSLNLHFTYRMSPVVQFSIKGGPYLRSTPTQKVRGMNAKAQIYYFVMSDVFYTGIGLNYKNYTVAEEVIVSRLNDSYFEELFIRQDQSLFGVYIPVGALVPLSDRVSLDMSVHIQFAGTKYIDIEDLPSDAVVKQLAKNDNGLLKVKDFTPRKSNGIIDVDFSILYHF